MKGTYVLVTALKEDSRIKVGKLGVINFPKGYYCYVGSALGKTINLENRTSRHKKLNMNKTGNLKWHIDYFLVDSKVSVIDTIMINNDRRMECKISREMKELSDKSINGFGSSDCNCKSHFHYFDDKKYNKILKKMVS